MSWLVAILMLSNGGDYGFRSPYVFSGIRAESSFGIAQVGFSPADKTTIPAYSYQIKGDLLVGGRIFAVFGPDLGRTVTPEWQKTAFRASFGLGYRSERLRVVYTHRFPLKDPNFMHRDAVSLETLGRIGVIVSLGTASYLQSGERRRVPAASIGARIRL